MNKVVTGFLTGVLLLGLTACSKSQDPSTVQAQAGDPANGNLAAGDQSTAPPDQAASTAPAPAYSQAPAQNYAPPPAGNSYADASYDASYDGSNEQPVYATEPPPPLPEYNQPACPGDDYIWTPGYWAWQNTGYYWVPGVWVTAPYVDALWTPPYWGFVDGRYLWHRGYWGPHIGFYGGINYGFGYTGHGYYGAYWNNGAVYYNRSVTNINTTVVRNVYNYSVPAAGNARISYNGGRGGVNARPLPAEQVALREPHAAPVAAQVQHVRQAATNREQFAAVNRGRPQVAAAAAPLATPYRTPAPRPAAVAQALQRPNPGVRPGPETRGPETRGPEARREVQPVAPQPNRQAPAAPENRMAARQPQSPTPAPAARQPFENRVTPQAAPATREPFRENRPAQQPVPTARQPLPENRPTPQAAPVTRQPVPQNRPAPQQPQQRFEARPAPQPAARPAPAPQPQIRQAPPAPRQEARPAPQPAARPAPVPQPAARPAPQPAARPAPAGRPEEHKKG
jgi:WXXGXW repeat (2 copies)